MNPDNENERPLSPDPDPSVSGGPGEGRDGAADGGPGTMDVQSYIGRQLRAVYDDVVKQPIPDRFLALMKQLEEQGPKD